MALTDLGNSWLALFGWTLVHFLWEGLLILGVCLVWLRLWKDRPPSARYAVALSALLVLAIAPIATFSYFTALEHQAPRAMAAGSPPRPPMPAEPVDLHHVHQVLQTPYNKPSPLASSIADKLSPRIPYITAAWIVGLILLGLVQVIVYGLAQRSVASSYRPVPALEPKVSELATKLGIRRRIRIGNSRLVNSPATVGFYDPVILLPEETATLLQPQQVELLLLHELAHVQRHDYLVNLFQVAFEAAFFWHPATWYLSKRVRIEREHCCDDVAALSSGKVLEYARTLTFYEKLRRQVPALSQPLAGGSLKDRIARLLQQHAEKLGPRGRAIPLISLAITLGTALLAVPMFASVVGDMRILHELNNSNLAEQVYRTFDHADQSDEAARAALAEMVASPGINAWSESQLIAFAKTWESKSTPSSLWPVIVDRATATETRDLVEPHGFQYGSHRQIEDLGNSLWITAQAISERDPSAARTCTRAALLLASQEPFSIGVGARRMIVEPSFATLAQLDGAQQQRLWRILGHSTGIEEWVTPQVLKIMQILDREDVSGKRLQLSDAKELRACIEATLPYTHHRPDIAAKMASITRRLCARLASDPSLAAEIHALVNSPVADDLFRKWAQPLPEGVKDPKNYIGIFPEERTDVKFFEVLPASPPRSK